MNNRGTMEQKNKLIPELRFPEFVKNGEWKLTSIGEIGDFYYGKSAPKWSLSEEAPTLCVRYGELYTKFDTIITEVKSRTNIDPSDLKFSKGGEILVPRVGERATDFAKNCCYLPYANIAIGEMISVFETKEFALFYTHYFRTLWREFAEVVEGQNVKNLYYVNLEPIKIGKPSYEEQQKIADCLSSLDELITAHTDKLEALKNHKKALLQNLFPQEGKKTPNYRFPEFVNDGKWEEKKLGDLIKLLSGYAFQSEFFSEKGKKLITPKNFNKTGYAVFNDENTKFTTENFDEKYLCRAGDLLILLTDLTPSCELLGKPVLLNENNDEVLLNQRIVKVIPSDKIYTTFLLYFFLTDNYTRRIKSNATGSTVRHSSSKIILDTDIFIPLSIQEQQKIAVCLNAVDHLITAQTEKIEQLKTHKKGLIQGLFPKVNI